MKIGRFETNNIYNEDCYKALKDIPDNSIDCIYTDIPYLISNVKNKKVGENASKVAKQVRAVLKQLVNSDIVDGIDYNIFYDFKRIMKNINCFIWCSKEQIYPIMKWWAENSNATLNILVWCKTNPTPKCNGTWLPDVEYCLYFNRETKLNDGYNLKSKWYLSEINVEDKKKYDHPTIKPLDLVERHLLHTTRRGGVVLDMFLGSGTTCVAAKNIGREYLGFEINKEFYEIAKDRLEGITKRERERLDNGEQSLFDFM